MSLSRRYSNKSLLLRLSGLFVFFIFTFQLTHQYYTFFTYEINASSLKSILYNGEQRDFQTASQQIILYPKCLCQKEYIIVDHLPPPDDLYKITIKTLDQTRHYSYNISTNVYENLLLTCDLYNSLRRGPNQRVISYTIDHEGRDHLSNENLLTYRVISSNAKIFYPNWLVRVYAGDKTDQAVNQK
jgi:hypothetical protein